MKKLFLISAMLFGIFTGTNLFAQGFGYGAGYGSGYGPGYGDQACGEQPAGECWCKYVRYEPCYYTTTRCVDEQIPCTKRCCRYVPQYYEVQRCRYVPQYYSVTCCRQVPEYYDECYTRCCKKTICEPCCKYVPRYYWKRVCAQPACAPACAPTCAPAAPVCP